MPSEQDKRAAPPESPGSASLRPEVLRSPQLLARILDFAEDAVISIDADHRICIFNQGAARIFGYTAEEVLGLPLDTLIPQRFRGEHGAHVGKFVKSPIAARVMAQREAVFGVRKDGTEFPAEVSISKVRIDGVAIQTAILRDITQRKEAEDQLKRTLEEREVLLREVHHRVKNNLQVVSSLLNLQSRATNEDYVRRAFEESQNRVQSMALIHEQLYESRNFAAVDFPDYVRQLAGRLCRSYETPVGRIEIETSIGDVEFGVDVAVPCGLIVNELLSNSLKHAFPDGRPGKVYVRCEKLSDGSVLLAVGDDGCGLPPEIGFWNTKTLGLRLVRTLVRQLDGEIELTRPPGVEFRIRFSPQSERS